MDVLGLCVFLFLFLFPFGKSWCFTAGNTPCTLFAWFRRYSRFLLVCAFGFRARTST